MEESHLKGKCLRNFTSFGICVRERSRSGQSSLEYLLVVALTLALIVPTTYLFYYYSKESSQEITDAQVTKLGRSVIDNAESIFYSGKGSKTVLELNVPDKIQSAVIVDGRELIFNVTTTSGISEIVFFSSINLSTKSSNCISNVCSIPEFKNPGLLKLRVEAVNNSVKVETI